MNKLTQTKNSVKKFVADHKVGITFVTTTVITTALCAKMSRLAVAQREDFLKEKGLLDEFNAQFEED